MKAICKGITFAVRWTAIPVWIVLHFLFWCLLLPFGPLIVVMNVANGEDFCKACADAASDWWALASSR